jgi:hypothetical protein
MSLQVRSKFPDFIGVSLAKHKKFPVGFKKPKPKPKPKKQKKKK